MKMDKNMDLYNMIVEMDSKEKIFKGIAINMICQMNTITCLKRL